MASWWRQTAIALGVTGSGSWRRRVATALGSTSLTGPWARHIAETRAAPGTVGPWDRRTATDIGATTGKGPWARLIVENGGLVEPPEPPAAMFAAGEVGAWYDPSDLSTLFQDAAMTIPVIADGDRVGAMLDKSGNDFHVFEENASQRPTYKTNGTLHWLTMARIASTMAATKVFSWDTSVTDAYFGAAIQIDTSDSFSTDYLFAVGVPGNRVALLAQGMEVRADFISNDNIQRSFEVVAADTKTYVDSISTAAAFGTVDVQALGVAGTPYQTNNPPSFSSASCKIGFHSYDWNTGSDLLMTFFGGIFVLRTMSPEDRATMQAFFAGKAGL